MNIALRLTEAQVAAAWVDASGVPARFAHDVAREQLLRVMEYLHGHTPAQLAERAHVVDGDRPAYAAQKIQEYILATLRESVTEAP